MELEMSLYPPPERNTRASNRLRFEDRAFHDWYRFVLSFPPHLVSDFVSRWDLSACDVVLDPFCGTGTTLVEAQKLGFQSIGLEPNAMAFLAAQVKTKWEIDPDRLWEHSQFIAEKTTFQLERKSELKTLGNEAQALILTHSISPLPLHKALILQSNIEKYSAEGLVENQKLALAKSLVQTIGNLRFGPEVGITKPKFDAPVVESWLSNIRVMCNDLRQIQGCQAPDATIFPGDARACNAYLAPNSVDAVITSPPYPNEKDYTRTTRLESVILGLISTKAELRQLKSGLLRSNTRGIYRADTDDLWVKDCADIQRIAAQIEARRIELGKTSGFEKLYARVTLLYFGGMTRHLASMRASLRPGARLVYIVGDQASYLRVMIRTGQLLAQIAESLGYEVENIELFRTRLSTATGEQLREEALILRWNG